jgi:hypothetical protein
MRPSEWRDLRNRETSDELQREVIASLRRLVNASITEEEAYEVAVELTNACIWDKVNANAAATGLLDADDSTLKALLDGLPENVAEAIESLRRLTGARSHGNLVHRDISGRIKPTDRFFIKQAEIKGMKVVIVEEPASGERQKRYEVVLNPKTSKYGDMRPQFAAVTSASGKPRPKSVAPPRKHK